MPTGYTAAVQSGEITELKPFVMRCARAFGALIDMREDSMDAPIPEKLEPHTSYYDECLQKTREEREHIVNMTLEEAKFAVEQDYQKRLADWERYEAQNAEHRARYEAMLTKVKAWEAPKECHSLKSFMVEQLTKSIVSDCCSIYETKPERVSLSKWLADELDALNRNILYHENRRAEEIKRTEERNAWLSALRASLD